MSSWPYASVEDCSFALAKHRHVEDIQQSLQHVGPCSTSSNGRHVSAGVQGWRMHCSWTVTGIWKVYIQYPVLSTGRYNIENGICDRPTCSKHRLSRLRKIHHHWQRSSGQLGRAATCNVDKLVSAKPGDMHKIPQDVDNPDCD